MAYFKIVPKLLLPMTVLLFIVCLSRAEAADQRKKYKFQNLPKLLHSTDSSTDFVAFTDFNKDYEKTAHQASIEYLDTHPQLVQRIRKDLDSEEVHWQLEGLSHRLLYVPESRENVAELFTDYCLETIKDMLDLTGLINPYTSISTQMDIEPDTTDDSGIKAVIVQELAREYVARYKFSGTSKKRIEIGLSGRIALNEVGSYSSYLHYSQETSSWKFSHNQQTVWKSVSANPYTVLMTPLEETLHIALREHTEKAIMTMVSSPKENPTLEQLQKAVEEWLAVEEAIVGGLVYNIINDVVIKRIPDLPWEWIEADLDTKDGFRKYRHLRKGIELVNSFGLRESIDLYTRYPNAFRKLLMHHS